MTTSTPTDALLRELHPIETRLMLALPESEAMSPSELKGQGLDAAQIRTAVQWLLGKSLIHVVESTAVTEVSVSEAGQSYLRDGTPEQRVLSAIDSSATPTMQSLGGDPLLEGLDVGAACGALKKTGAIDIGPGGVLKIADPGARQALERQLELANRLAAGGPTTLAALTSEEQAWVQAGSRKRGRSKGLFKVTDRTIDAYATTPLGAEVQRSLRAAGATGDEVSLVSPAMLRDGSWRQAKFRRFNLSLKPPRVLIGHRHPYGAFLDGVRDRFTRLGFAEMRGNLVENEFWLMDALFMPQFHSARDIHDVYYVKDPTHSSGIEAPFGERVAEAHESGYDTGSRGWGYVFDAERTKRLVLRSQGTALSARTLAGKPRVPGKYFAIARCFRYDQIDATHAAEFYQVEGIVLGKDLNLRHLLGLLELFAKEIAGADEYRFTPGYFPFTEPSVEIHVNHPELGWMELGGSGIFRPELTAPLGIDVPVLAWGLGIDRMAMTALGISDIRQLFTTDLDFVRQARVS